MYLKRKNLCEMTDGTWECHVHPDVIAHRYKLRNWHEEFNRNVSAKEAFIMELMKMVTDSR